MLSVNINEKIRGRQMRVWSEAVERGYSGH